MLLVLVSQEKIAFAEIKLNGLNKKAVRSMQKISTERMVLLSCIMLYKNICNYLIAILFMDKSVTIALAKQSTLVYMQRCARQKLCNGSQQEQTTALTFGVVSVELIFRMDENQVLALMVQSLKNAVLVSSK